MAGSASGQTAAQAAVVRAYAVRVRFGLRPGCDTLTACFSARFGQRKSKRGATLARGCAAHPSLMHAMLACCLSLELIAVASIARLCVLLH
jgi:hypothetical protein